MLFLIDTVVLAILLLLYKQLLLFVQELFCLSSMLLLIDTVVLAILLLLCKQLCFFCSGAVLAILNVVADCSGCSVAALQAIVFFLFRSCSGYLECCC